MISTAKSQTCNFSIQFSGSCDQSANSLNKRNHDHANVSLHNSHHQFYLITSVHGDNQPQEGSSSVNTSYSPSRIDNVMRQTPIWNANSSLITQAERLKAVGVPKTSKYSDTHTHGMLTTDLCIPLCSLRTYVSPYAHYVPVYPRYTHYGPGYIAMFTMDLYIPLCPLRTCISLYAHYGYPYIHNRPP